MLNENVPPVVPPQGFSSVPVTPPPPPTVPPTPSVPPMPPISPAQPAPAPVSNGGNKTLIISSIVVLFLIGAGAYGYFTYIRPSLTPEEVLNRMMEKSSVVKTLKYDGEIIITPEETTSTDTEELAIPLDISGMTMRFDAVSDMTNLAKMKFSTKMDMSLEMMEEVYDAGIEVRFVDDVIYASVYQLPEATPLFLSGIKNQWIKIDLTELAETYGYEEDLAEIEELDLSEEKIKALQIAAQEANMIRISQVLPEETIDGTNTYHYEFFVDKVGMEQYLLKVIEIMGSDPLTPEETAEFKEMLESIGTPAGTIWIGKRDFLPRKLLMDFQISEEETNSSTYMGFSMNFTQFNQPVSIEAPADAQSLEEFMGSFLGPTFMD